jgi:biotin--protein ligase
MIVIRFAPVNLDPNSDGPGYPAVVKALAEDDESRVNFLKACLAKLGLIISQETSSVPSLSRLHLSSQHHFLVPELLASWEDIITKEDGEEYIRGENDTFHLEKQSSRWSLGSLVKALPLPGISATNQEQEADETANAGSDDRIVDYNTITKRIIPHETEWPGTKETPYFNHHSFYANLKGYQEESGGEADEFGKSLLYGEVVTSTNTILEK